MFVEEAKNREFFGKQLNNYGRGIISETPKNKLMANDALSYNKRGAKSSALLRYDRSSSVLGGQSRE